MQELGDNPTVGEMRFDNLFDAVVIEVAIANRPGPDGKIWAVIATSLTATCTYLAARGEVMVFERVCEC